MSRRIQRHPCESPEHCRQSDVGKYAERSRAIKSLDGLLCSLRIIESTHYSRDVSKGSSRLSRSLDIQFRVQY
jgi:hypothetical protein